MRALLLAVLLLACAARGGAQCASTEQKVKVVLRTDFYPGEIAWSIKPASGGTPILQSAAGMTDTTTYKDSVCAPLAGCYTFTITDAAADGICCGYGYGAVYVYVDGALAFSDSSYGSGTTFSFSCPPGSSCGGSFAVAPGSYTAPGPDTWYSFSPAATGMYEVKTCGLGNTCDTKLWIYDYCAGLSPDSGVASTIYYADNNCGGTQASINAYLSAGDTYYIRVGGVGGSCAGSSINWSLAALAAVSGCLDTTACNFNPFATISTPSSCIYYPSALCPTGSDLIVDSTKLATTIGMDTLTSDGLCTIREGCMNGYGQRQLVRFSTRIDNIGATDFYAGAPPALPTDYDPIFEWDACHGHWHFEDYAEYLLADMANNFIPIGYKNGFCVLDLGCTTGSAKFGCGNMGITAGCFDVYDSYLPCQWIDVTDVADGTYKLIVRANWRPRPDYYGRYETGYTNNWAQSCITLGTGAGGARTVAVLPACAPYTDCAGVVNGLSTKDCAGLCGGTRLEGDLDANGARDGADMMSYLLGAVQQSLAPMLCNDLNRDTAIDVVDAALLLQCAAHGAGGGIPDGHSHEPCRFPSQIKNPGHTAHFSIGSIDYAAKTIDIFLRNPEAEMVGYQFHLEGLTPQSGAVLGTGFSAHVVTDTGGGVAVLAYADTAALAKHAAAAPVLRISWKSIDSTAVCIRAVAAVNNAFEEMVVALDSPACLAAIPTPDPAARVDAPAAAHPYTLHPNPAGAATELRMEQARGPFTAVLYDATGRAVQHLSGAGRTLAVARGALAPGLYVLDVRGEGWRICGKVEFR